MRVVSEQFGVLAYSQLLERVKTAFVAKLKGFASLEPAMQDDFLVSCLFHARSLQLLTEQGFASYSLAAWWLDIGFEERSRNLMALLRSGYPELRIAYAMNEWVAAMIGNPLDMAQADQCLIRGFHRTQAWGGRSSSPERPA